MRVLALCLAAAAAVAGCVNLPAPGIEPGATVAPGTIAVHRAGELLPIDPASVLGAVPQVVERLLGTRGAEPNVGVTSSGAIFVSSGDLVMRSLDDGVTWEMVREFGDIHPPMVPGAPVNTSDPIRNSDPMLWVDKDTDRVFHPVMWPALGCASGAYSDDDGETWGGRPLACGLPPLDHQKVATGKFTGNGPLRAAGDYPNAVYFCYNKIVSSNCAVSLDGGETYTYEAVVAQDDCAGVTGHPAVAPDGVVYVPLGGLADGCPARVAVSDDNGFSWDLRRIYNGDHFNEEINPDVAVGPDGTAYFMFRSARDHRTYMMRSADGFLTSDGPFLVSAPDLTSTRFAGLVAGDDGKLAFGYLGTRDADSRPREAPDSTRWHLFMTFTNDAKSESPTFVTVQVTPEDDPVQIGYMWESGGSDPARNLLDFIEMTLTPDGRPLVAFADGCTSECAGVAGATKAESRARDTAIAILVDGPRLLSEPAAPAAKEPGLVARLLGLL